MNKKTSGIGKFCISAIFASLFIAGCGSTQNSQQAQASQNTIPDWVLNPVVQDGLAAADCVRSSSSMSVDRKSVIANARVALAQQINTNVKAMDKTYARRTDAGTDSDVATTFESVSSQLTNQSLSGSKAIKVDMAVINSVNHLCALVTLSPEESQTLFDRIIKSSKANLNQNDKARLYEEFRAEQAQEELRKRIEGL